MNFSLAYLKSNQQFIVKSFSAENIHAEKILDINELSQSKIDGLIYPSILLEEENFQARLQEEVKFTPVRSNDDLSIAQEDFENLNFENAKTIYSKIQSSWVLQNNLNLLENLFPLLKHLSQLWPNDRTTFFEELWFILRNNLGASELKLIYNDVQKSDKEGDRGKLIHSFIDGERIPVPQPGTELESSIMKSYENSFGPHFEISEFSKEKGELIAISHIKQSPVLIMAKSLNMTQIQKSLLKSLFIGLSESI